MSDQADSKSLEKGRVSHEELTPRDELEFGGDITLPKAPVLSETEQAALWRKVDLRLMPMLTIMYLCSFLDRGNIGNAKIAGLVTQLDLIKNDYNIALTMYFVMSNNTGSIRLLSVEKSVPIALLSGRITGEKFRPSRWLPGITVLWGTVMTLMGIVKTYPQLVGVRICLGVAEAGLFPGVVYYLSMWYPRHMLQWRIGLFYGAATLAGAFSGLLAFGIEHMNGTQGLESWSWIFILEGIATVAVGLVAFFVVVDFPVTARFLTPEERAWLIWKKKYDNSSVGESEHFEMRYLWAALSDWQVWVHILIYMSIVAPLYGISLFLPSIINGFGFSVPITQLLTVPPYFFATILLGTFAYLSDKYKIRSLFILIGLSFCTIGFAINISGAPIGAKYFGTFLVVGGSYAAFPGIVTWLGNNLAGQYKRGVGMAVHIGIGNFAGAIASNIFRTQDAPRYILGYGIEFMFVGIGFIFVPITVFTYRRINAARDKAERDGAVPHYTPQELRELGDRAPDFRYTL